MSDSNRIFDTQTLREQIDRLPRFPLGHLPTPLEPLPRLSRTLDGPAIHIKRDDCTGLAFGGNKTRHNEFLIADAIEKGADLFVWGAGVQSNNCRQTAAACAKAGLDCHLVLGRGKPAEGPDAIQGNLLLDHLVGASYEIVDEPVGAALDEKIAQRAQRFIDEGRAAYMWDRETVKPLAAVSYMLCMIEIVEQTSAAGFIPDAVYVCSAGSTGSGLALAAKALGQTFPVRSICPIEWEWDTLDEMTEIANRTAELIGIDTRMSRDELDITFDYIGPGYGVVSSGCLEAIALTARMEGIFLDPTYSGKALAGLIDHIRNGSVADCQNETGPVSTDQLQSLASTGELLPDDEVRKKDEESWSAASELAELDFAESPGKPPALPNRFDSAGEPAPVEPGVPTERTAKERFATMFATARSETARITRVTGAHFAVCAGLMRAKWKKRGKAKTIDNAVVRLGEAMYQSAIGDEKLRAKIEDIEDRIESLRAAKGSHRNLDTEHRGMMIRLAQSPLPDDPPEAVAAAAADLAAAREAAEEHDASTRELRGRLLPAGQGDGLRLTAGYGATVISMLLLIFIGGRMFGGNPVSGSGTDPESAPAQQIVQGASDEERMTKAVGFVVCGREVVYSDGSISELADSVGSAFVVTPDGFLVTNKHVVEPAIKTERKIKAQARNYERQKLSVTSRVWVFLGKDQKFKADIKYISKKYDLAVVKVEATDLPVFRLNGEDDPKRTTRVIACGFPLAATAALSDKERAEAEFRKKKKSPHVEEHFKSRDFDFGTTAGSVGKVTEESGGTTWIQHDAQIHGGNSGGPLGVLRCLNLADGKVIWTRQTHKDFGAPAGYFGAGSTPIVVGKNLLVNVGSRDGAAVVAFDLNSGKTAWKSFNDTASYSSPVLTTIDGTRHVIFITRLNLVSLDPSNGKVRFSFPFGKRGPTVNGASPVVINGHVFASAHYGIGAVYARIGKTDAKIDWKSDAVMSSQYATSIAHDGNLYGIHGQERVGPSELRCFDPKTKKIHWSKTGLGYGSLLKVDGKFLLLTTEGELLMFKADPKGYKELARASVLRSTTRALPALSDGLLYVRDAKTLRCLKLRRK
eukprot:g5265.t1